MRRNGDRRYRHGRRVGDHRRVGTGAPRVRQRAQRRHRRHARAVEPDSHRGMTRAHPRPVSALAIRAPRIPRQDGVKSSHSRCSFAEVRTDYLARTGARTARRSKSSGSGNVRRQRRRYRGGCFGQRAATTAGGRSQSWQGTRPGPETAAARCTRYERHKSAVRGCSSWAIPNGAATRVPRRSVWGMGERPACARRLAPPAALVSRASAPVRAPRLRGRRPRSALAPPSPRC